MNRLVALAFVFLPLLALPSRAADTGLARGVRGLVTRAPGKVTMDGRLDEWTDAFCTPVHYNHSQFADRAAQFFYMWDDEAFYLGLRALDQHRGNAGDMRTGSLWNGDAVEFYFDTRQGAALRSKDWTAGAVHLFFTPFEGKELKPRWTIRQGIATSDTKLEGVEVQARNTDFGYEMECKLPWKNFPDFKPQAGALLGIDAELCSGEGGGRTDRTFAYGSPLSVTQPASQGLVQLVEKMEPQYLPQVGAALFPLWVETPWSQSRRAEVVAVVAIPPAMNSWVHGVVLRIHDTNGKIVKEIPARREVISRPDFVRSRAAWSNDDFAPGTFFVTARINGPREQVLATVAPRLVQEAQMSGR
jgi:hypothetical protein